MSKTYNSRYKINKSLDVKYEYPHGYSEPGKLYNKETKKWDGKINPGETAKFDYSHTTSSDDERPFITNKFSRHPNKKNRRHTLSREWKGEGIGMWWHSRDKRLGDCYDRGDRCRATKRAYHSSRRNILKRETAKEIENSVNQ